MGALLGLWTHRSNRPWESAEKGDEGNSHNTKPAISQKKLWNHLYVPNSFCTAYYDFQSCIIAISNKQLHFRNVEIGYAII
jgi:hypothetical protein